MNPSTTNGMANTNPQNNISSPVGGFNTSTGAPIYNTPSDLPTTNPAYVAPEKNQSTTTLSSDKTADIANNNAALTSLSTKGVTTDPNTGIATTADGAAYDPAKLLSADTSSEDAQIQNNFNQMRANTDAITASNIAGIQNRYQVLKDAQKQVNDSQTAGTVNALINSGALQHDVYSNDSIKLRIDEGTKKITDLENEENDLINAAKVAQMTANNKLLENINTEIQSKRTEKIAETNKLNDAIIAETTKAREAATQAKKDTAIANIYGQGTTDVPSILAALKKAGYDNITSKDVSDTLTNIVPKGLDDLVKTLRTNGAPQDVISKVLSSQNIDDAYKNAGSWGAGGTGIIGEYNFYKAQAEAKGQVPLSFSAYQNEDANRKQKAITPGSSAGKAVDLTSLPADVQKKVKDTGFTKFNSTTQDMATQLVNGQMAPSQLSKRTTGDSSYSDILTAANLYSQATTGKAFDAAKAERNYKFAQRPQTQDTLNYMGSLVGSADENGNLSGGNLQELLTLSNSIDRTSFPALNNAERWASLASGDARYAQFQAVATEVADQVAKILQGGGTGGTSDAKLQQAVNLFNTGFTKSQMEGVITSLKPLLANRASSMIKDNPYLSDYADQFGVSQDLPNGTKTNTGSDIIKTETDAQNTVDAAAKADSSVAKVVYDQLSKPDPTLGRVMTYSEVLQYLQAIGKIKQ